MAEGRPEEFAEWQHNGSEAIDEGAPVKGRQMAEGRNSGNAHWNYVLVWWSSAVLKKEWGNKKTPVLYALKNLKRLLYRFSS